MQGLGLSIPLAARQPAPRLQTAPAIFATRWPASQPVHQIGATYATDFDITTLKPAVTITYYVDPVAGADANAGTSRGAPLLNLSTALLKSDVDEVRIINLTADFVGRGTGLAGTGQKGWNNCQPTRSLSVIIEGPHRYISAGTSSQAVPVWTATGGRVNVYQSAFITASSVAVIDCTAKSQPAFAPGAMVPGAALAILANAPPRYRAYNKLASIAAVEAQLGSWFNDGAITYVHPFDDRDLTNTANTPKLIVGHSTNNGRYPDAAGRTVYLEGLDFVGGNTFNALTLNTGSKLVTVRCGFHGSVGQGLAITAPLEVYSYRSACYDNNADGFNYHANPANGLAATEAASPKWMEIECVAAGNGTTGSANTSDNASTPHERAAGIQLNCVYPDSDDRVVVSTDAAYTLCFGVVAGQAKQQIPARETFAALSVSIFWLYGCAPVRGTGQGNPDFIATGTASVFHRDMTGVVNAGTGEATGTVAAF